VPTSPAYNFRRVWGTLSDDVYITYGGSKLMHYNGTGWALMTIPGAQGYLYDIDGTGPNDITVVGGTGGEFSTNSSYCHFDGAAWSASYGSPWLVLTDVWVDPVGEAYVIGHEWSHLDQAELYYVYFRDYFGSWSKLAVHAASIGDRYYGVSGYGWDHVNITGYLASPYPEMAPSGPVIDEKSSGDWYLLPSGESCQGWGVCPIWPTTWYGAWGAPPNDTWFCGTNGKVLLWNNATGTTTRFSTPTTATLRAIWGTSGTDVYAVGDGGAIVHYDGSSWSAMASGTTWNLSDVFGTPAPEVATLLQSFSIDAQPSHVAIRWSLSACDEGTGFRVTRLSPARSAAPLVIENPSLERTALSFTYVDRDVTPGDEYSYIVEYSSEGSWRQLFETETVTMPKTSFALQSNYPNPFNPSTTISYSIDEPGRVALRIYNVSGRLVRTLLEEDETTGAYSVQWNGLDDKGRPVASGTYFCRLTAGKKSTSHKILMTR
jgi:hypothetical protein